MILLRAYHIALRRAVVFSAARHSAKEVEIALSVGSLLLGAHNTKRNMKEKSDLSDTDDYPAETVTLFFFKSSSK